MLILFQLLFFCINRFKRQIGILRNGISTDLLLVIIHTGVPFTLLDGYNSKKLDKFDPQIISGYPVAEPHTNDNTKCE